MAPAAAVIATRFLVAVSIVGHPYLVRHQPFGATTLVGSDTGLGGGPNWFKGPQLAIGGDGFNLT